MSSVLAGGNDTDAAADPDQVIDYSRGLLKSTGNLVRAVMVKNKESKEAKVNVHRKNYLLFMFFFGIDQSFF